MKLNVLKYLKKELWKWVGKCFAGLGLIFGAWWGFLPFEFFYLVGLPIVLAISVLPWLVVTVMIYWKEWKNKKILAEKERIEKGLEKRSFKDNLKFFVGIVAILFLFLLWALYLAFGILIWVLLVHFILFFMGVVENPLSDQSSVWGWTAGLLVVVLVKEWTENRLETKHSHEVREIKKRIKELEGKIDDSDSD